MFGVNADPATTADVGDKLFDVDQEIYLGTMLQNASNPKFRLPEKAKPSEFFAKIDPTLGEPGINQVIKMPEYPNGSLFMQNGLIAASLGYKVAEQINAMSAYQNTLAPPPYQSSDKVADSSQLSMAGTLLRGINPDPSASLRVLVDRNLRKPTVAANRANADLQRVNVDGSGHNYWVNRQAGFSTRDQTI